MTSFNLHGHLSTALHPAKATGGSCGVLAGVKEKRAIPPELIRSSADLVNS